MHRFENIAALHIYFHIQFLEHWYMLSIKQLRGYVWEPAPLRHLATLPGRLPSKGCFC